MTLERIGKEREHFKIYQRVFDNYTLKSLTTLASKGYFQSLDYPISTGKEADVYRCTTKKGFIAAKIYRIETSNFRAMQKYLLGDPRFRKFRRGKRNIVKLWCQKELRNLRDAQKAGVEVPKPIKNLNNVLLMEFIGEDGVPDSLLKNIKPKNPKKVIDIVIDYIEKMWKKAEIVHGDISEFNIMMHRNKPILIDIGQALSVKHPIALELLQRDLHNVERLAKKYKVSFNYKKNLEKILGEKVHD